jgi:hypothetical protein
VKRKVSVTVILNIFRRNYLDEQLAAIREQTVTPEDIWIIQLGNYLSPQALLVEFPDIKYIHSTLDIKYFGRYSLARFAKTKYCFIIDDDVIPASSWIETCISICEEYEAIVCSNGRLIPPNDFTPEVAKDDTHFAKYFIGDAMFTPFNYSERLSLVDYPSSSYFFKTKWLNYFWGIKPYTLECGEDIHLAASCMVRGQVPVVVPQQRNAGESGNITPQYSNDEHASYKRPDFVALRKQILEYLIKKKKWTPLLWRDR